MPENLSQRVKSFGQQIDKLISYLLELPFDQDPKFDNDWIVKRSEPKLTLAEFQRRSAQILARLESATATAEKENLLTPLTWKQSISQNIEKAIESINQIKNDIEHRKSNNGGLKSARNDNPEPYLELICTDGSTYDVTNNFDKIVSHHESLLSLAGVVPSAQNAREISRILGEASTEIAEKKGEILSLRRAAKQSVTVIDNLAATTQTISDQISSRDDESKKAVEETKSSLENIRSANEHANELRNDTNQLSSDISAFRETFDPFRKSLSDTRAKIDETGKLSDTISDEYETRTEYLSNLENKASKALGISTTAGLAGKFRQAERRLSIQSGIALFFLVASLAVLLVTILYTSGWDIGIPGIEYYREFNAQIISAEWGPLKILAIRGAMILPALILFAVVFAVYRRLDSERRVYTYKRTLAEAAGSFSELITDPDASAEKRKILSDTFEHLVFNPSQAEMEAASASRLGFFEKVLLARGNMKVPGIGND